VRREDKGAIVAFHWRGAPHEADALAAVEEIETAAQAIGFETRRGRKVLEIQPPVPIGKGRGIHWLLADDPPVNGVYVGDDTTDIDAFAGLRDMLGDGAVCIGVRSDETPEELEEAADALVDGPEGVTALLGELLR
jgi:trehalose 6-phosphate phosphatase